MIRSTPLLAALALAFSLGAASAEITAPTLVRSGHAEAGRAAQPGKVPAMRWGERNEGWTRAALEALEGEGVTLLSTVPADVMQFCPGYATQSRENRAAFWAGLVSALARHESGMNARAKGGGGKYLGLMQISRPTASAHGCGGSMLRGEDNLRCAIRIMARQVRRDGAIAAGSRGVARDWMPMRSGAKRADIAGWTRRQSYCQHGQVASR